MHGVAKRWWSLVKAVTKRDLRQVLSDGSSQNLQPLVPQHSGLCLVVQMVDGCCPRFPLTPLALVVQVVLVWGKLCLVGGSTWALASAAGQLVCLSTFSALWNVPSWTLGHRGKWETDTTGSRYIDHLFNLFSRQQPQCKYCTTDCETSEKKVFGSVTLPVTANHVIPVHDDQLQRVSHFIPVEWSSLEYKSTKYQFRNLTIQGRVGSGGINSKRFYHFTWKQVVT